MGDYGAYAGEGRRTFPRDHGFVRASRPGHGDARQCGERGERVHGPVHSRVGESTPHPSSPSLCVARQGWTVKLMGTRRWDGWRMRSDGTTRILGTAVGSLASTSTRK